MLTLLLDLGLDLFLGRRRGFLRRLDDGLLFGGLLAFSLVGVGGRRIKEVLLVTDQLTGGLVAFDR